jgi:hypothetical protein
MFVTEVEDRDNLINRILIAATGITSQPTQMLRIKDSIPPCVKWAYKLEEVAELWSCVRRYPCWWATCVKCNVKLKSQRLNNLEILVFMKILEWLNEWAILIFVKSDEILRDDNLFILPNKIIAILKLFPQNYALLKLLHTD